MHEDVPAAQRPTEDPDPGAAPGGNTAGAPAGTPAAPSARARGPRAVSFWVTGLLHAGAASYSYQLGAPLLTVMTGVIAVASLATAVLLTARSPHAGVTAGVVKIGWDHLGFFCVAVILFASWHNSWLHQPRTLTLAAFSLLAAAGTARSATRRLPRSDGAQSP